MNINQDKMPSVEVDQENFESEVLRSKLPVLAAFWAPWSQPCQVFDSVLDELAIACAGRVKVVKVNADDNPELSLCYEVQSIPTLLFFANGNLQGRVVGTASKEAILAKLPGIGPCGDPTASLRMLTKNMSTTTCEPGPAAPPDRYSARWTRHHVDFFCDAPEAKSVQLVGDFNGWDPAATPMRRMPDGRWMASLELHHGHHQYRFLVDGTPMLDPAASGVTRNDANEPVSLIPVS